jgi:hypothetical protein
MVAEVSMSELTRRVLSGNFLACCLQPFAVVVASASSSWVSGHKVHGEVVVCFRSRGHS